MFHQYPLPAFFRHGSGCLNGHTRYFHSVILLLAASVCSFFGTVTLAGVHYHKLIVAGALYLHVTYIPIDIASRNSGQSFSTLCQYIDAAISC